MNITITSATVTREVGMGENPCRFSELLEKCVFCSKQVEGLLSEKKFSRQEKKNSNALRSHRADSKYVFKYHARGVLEKITSLPRCHTKGGRARFRAHPCNFFTPPRKTVLGG